MKTLILTGGQPPGAPQAESEIAASRAAELGVPPEHLRWETRLGLPAHAAPTPHSGLRAPWSRLRFGAREVLGLVAFWALGPRASGAPRRSSPQACP